MTWRDQIAANSVGGARQRGSFRQATFLVRTDDLEIGRRNETHEYPQRDTPYVEDLGRKTRRFQIEVFVAGNNYIAERDALIAEIEKPGSGLLTHPYYGVLTVSIVDARVRQSSREGGTATFALTCVEGGANLFPASTADTAAKTDAAATAASDAAIAAFAKRFSVGGLPGWAVTAMEGEVASALAGVTAIVGDVAGAVAAEIRAPYNMAGLIVGNIQSIATRARKPFEALRLYRGLFDAGAVDVSTATATREQYTQSAAALHGIVATSAVIEACRTTSAADFASSDDALAERDALLDALEVRMEVTDPVTGTPIDDTLFNALRALRSALVDDMQIRGAKLPRVTYHTSAATLPALVVAYRVFGDAARAEEIVSRNKVRHPGFVPAGVALEILIDV